MSFDEWLAGLRGEPGKPRILVTLNRMALGLPGDWRSVGEGVFEQRIAYGPGYRLYYAREGPQVILLLIGGDKASQARDIKRAKQYGQEP
ncbi:MAG: type II toxin-antitoxin system RelE/ParE family toxin [Candidatus Competibacteraceae bacterium]